MFRNNRLFVSFMLVFALLAQPLAAMAQDKTLKSGGANSSAAQNGASVEIKRISLQGAASAVVDWQVTLPAGVEVQGFDVRIQAVLSNDQAPLSASRSFDGNARTGLFDFKLPAPGGASSPLLPNPNPGKPIPGTGSKGGNNSGGIGNNGNTGGGNAGGINGQGLCEVNCSSNTKKAGDFQKCVAACLKGSSGNNSGGSNGIKEKDAKESGKTPRKLGEGNISGGGKNTSDPVGGGVGSNNNTGGGSAKPILPKPIIPKPVDPKPADPKPTPKPGAVRITSLKALITAKFVAGNDLAAFREFVQPTDKITGELTPKGGRGSSLQVKKLIHLNVIPRLAAECPAGQDCFDVIAELREADFTGQFKVSLEAIYSNGLRKNISRTAGNLLRPVRLNVEKSAGATLTTVLVNINGGGNREQFTKDDVKGVAILQGIGGGK